MFQYIEALLTSVIKWWRVITSLVWWNGVTSDITSDVWWRPKTVDDFSTFHGLFTYDIPPQLWLTFENWTEVATSTRVTSVNGTATIKSWVTLWNTAFLRSKRHPRYQPNRWQLFSTAWFLPVPTAIGKRQIGFKNTITWVYFQLEDWVLYAVILNDSIEKEKEVIDLSLAGMTVADLAHGTLYDIQYQWRGVGDYFFYINQKLVHKTSFLGNNTELTTFNPAISVGLFCENTNGTEVEIQIGCVDVTSEWGKREWIVYTSVSNSATKAVNTANYPTLICHIPDTYKTLPNSRDVLALRCTGSSDQRTYMKAYVTRDFTAIIWATFNSKKPSSCVQFDVLATAIDTAKCELLLDKRIEINSSATVDLPSNLVDFYLSWWDYLIITCERDNPTQIANVVVTLEVGEEI